MKEVIGITGGIASGKSFVSKTLIDMGYEVIDSDLISKELSQKGKPLFQAIIQEFGKKYLTSTGDLNRKLLASYVFNNKEALTKLNALSHPLIVSEIKDRIEKSLENIIFVDIPLLFEAKLEYLCAKIVCVYVPRDLQLKRLMARDNINLEAANLRLNNQLDIEEKKKRADFVIDNSRSFEYTQNEILKLLKNLKGE